jgi:hypothetical protein
MVIDVAIEHFAPAACRGKADRIVMERAFVQAAGHHGHAAPQTMRPANAAGKNVAHDYYADAKGGELKKRERG